jgi:hypothetical protein
MFFYQKIKNKKIQKIDINDMNAPLLIESFNEIQELSSQQKTR